jgi:hypothetical protein
MTLSVDVFLDVSNLMRAAARHPARDGRVADFTALLGVGLAAGGEIRRAVAVLAAPPGAGADELANALAASGWALQTVGRPEEEDEALRALLEEHMREPPGGIVWLSGDGGFLPPLQAARAAGIPVLVAGISGTVHRAYFQQRFPVLLLDDLVLYPREGLARGQRMIPRWIRGWPGRFREILMGAPDAELDRLLEEPGCPFADAAGLRLWRRCWQAGRMADPETARRIHRALRIYTDPDWRGCESSGE